MVSVMYDSALAGSVPTVFTSSFAYRCACLRVKHLVAYGLAISDRRFCLDGKWRGTIRGLGFWGWLAIRLYIYVVGTTNDDVVEKILRN